MPEQELVLVAIALVVGLTLGWALTLEWRDWTARREERITRGDLHRLTPQQVEHLREVVWARIHERRDREWRSRL